MQDLRLRFADRTVRGQFNARRGDGANVVRLEPASHEVMIRFYRTSGSREGGMEFGSITVAKSGGVEGLADIVCDLLEMRYTVGMRDDGDEEHSDDGNEDDDDHTIDGGEDDG